MSENKKDVEKNIEVWTNFIFWLIGILAILASSIGTISSLTGQYSSNEFSALYEFINLFLLEIGLIGLASVAHSIEKSINVEYYNRFRYLYYITYCLGTIGYMITLVNLFFSLQVEKLKISIDEVIAIFILVAPFIFFQISFIRVHRLLKKI